MFRIPLFLVAIAGVTLVAGAFAQNAPKASPTPHRQAVKAESVTINMPEGMTRDQADAILKYGQKTNLDMTAFRGCLSDKKYTSAIQKDTADAGTLGISGTPSFVIGKTAKDEIAGVRIVGAVPYTVFESAIKDLLSRK